MRNKNTPKLPDSISPGLESQILKAACLEILEGGIGQVSLNKIAKRAKLSAQRLNYHYKSLDEILVQLLQAIFVSGRQVTMALLLKKSPRSPQDLILRMSEGMFVWAEEYPHLCRLSSVIGHLAPRVKGIGPMYGHELSVGYKRIQGALKAAYPRRKAKERDEIAKVLHLIMIGALEDFHRQGHKGRTKKQMKVTQGMLQTILALLGR